MAKLLALDIDDTLTGSSPVIPRVNAEAVAWAMSQGVRCTIITGRRYRLSADRFADYLGLGGPIGVHYGRRVVDHPSGRVLASHPLPAGCPMALLKIARRFPNAVFSAFLGDDFRFERLPAGWERSSTAQFSVGDLAEAFRGPEDIMTFLVSDSAGRGAGGGPPGSQDGDGLGAGPAVGGPPAGGAVEAVAEAGARLYPGRLEYYYDHLDGRERALLTVISAAADKGTALLDIARRLGVHPDDTVAMGDSTADIPMLEAAGLGVAMPCAGEEVRRAADIVMDGDLDDAVARAIRSLF